MSHLGDYDQSAVIYHKFTTYRPSTAAPFTLAGSPVISVYKDNSVTQSTSGASITADFDSVTGLNHIAVDTSSDATFYSNGSFFQVVVTTGTVDSVSFVGAVVASFTIRKDSALKPTTPGRTAVVDAAGLIDATAVKLGPSGAGTAQTARDVGLSVLLSSGTGTGQVKLSGGYVAPNWGDVGNPTTANALTGTTFSVTQVVASVSGAVGSVTGLNAALIDVSTSSRLASASYTAPDNATIAATALYLTGTLNPNVLAVAASVWDIVLGGHLTPGSTGAALNAAGGAGDPWITPLPGAYIAGQAGYLVGTYLPELWQLQGLDRTKPMTVSATQRLVAAITQAISVDTATGTTTVRRA